MVNEEIISFWRQLFVFSSFLFTSYSAGFMVPFPEVLNNDLLSPNCTEGIRATKEEISWIASVKGITGTISVVFLPLIMDSMGRKSVMLMIKIISCIGWLMIVFAKSVTWLVIGRSVQGVLVGCAVIAIITIGEYVHPVRRGYFVALKMAALSFGVLTCHIMSLFCTWRQIAVFCLFPSFFGVIIVPFWPESPPYLALKGKFAECEKSYVWLNGKSSISNRELVELITVQKSKLKTEEKICKKLKILRFFKSITSLDLLKPSAMAFLLVMVIESSGRNYFVVYIIQIMTELVKDLSLAAYWAIGVDILVLCASVCSVFLVQKLKRRTFLFLFGLISVILSYLMSVLVFLKSTFNMFKDFPVLIPVLLVIYCFFLNIGVLPAITALKGEIFPLKFRAYGSIICGFFLAVTYSLTLKFVPSLIENVGLSVLYAIFASVMLVCLVLLYFLLPETKDRPLQDIEFDITGEKLCIVENIPMIVKSKSNE